ncbi:glutamate-gated chloride channel-like [Penaeus chinensis]|uniref:glutamate-gated chloride channel-like n=1 Tax=Penaeus chinensis TaxID=139456 RepID=UPI001FB59517|nr:glutamate-gated chloride channel-like [Penaeus chinensis]
MWIFRSLARRQFKWSVKNIAKHAVDKDHAMITLPDMPHKNSLSSHRREAKGGTSQPPAPNANNTRNITNSKKRSTVTTNMMGRSEQMMAERTLLISMTLSCPMNLKLYPLDTQVCLLLMASYGWTTDDLLFLWEDNEPIQVTKNLYLPRFTLEHFVPAYCNSKTNTGEYSCLQVNLIFKREFSYYLIQYYIPCCMLVIVSWVSFWLDQYAVPARVALGVTTLLTMSTQTAGINQSLPPVSYTKAIDVWTGVCLTFVFGALLEFALVNYASRSDFQRKKQRRHWEMESQAAYDASVMENGFPAFAMRPLVPPFRDGGPAHLRSCEVHLQGAPTNCFQTWLAKFSTRSKRIDVIARITFPLVFALFNVAYWSAYLFRDDEMQI